MKPKETAKGLTFCKITDDVPDRILIFKDGLNSYAPKKGLPDLVMDQEAAASVISDFKNQGNEMVIDYEHQTEGGEFSSPDGTAPAAGWVEDFIYEPGVGLWAKIKEWTAKAVEFIKNKEYKYFSPVFNWNRDTRKIANIETLALTNYPATKNLLAIIAKMDIQPFLNKESNTMDKKALCKLLGIPEDTPDKEVMEKIQAMHDGERSGMKIIAKALNLGENVKVEDITAAITAAGQAERETVQAVAALVGLDQAAGKDAIIAKIKEKDNAMSADAKSIQALAGRIAAIEKETGENKVEQAIAKALTDNKLTAADVARAEGDKPKGWARIIAENNLKSFNDMVAAKAPVINTEDIDLGGDPQNGGVTAADKVVAKLYGETEENLVKYGK